MLTSSSRNGDGGVALQVRPYFFMHFWTRFSVNLHLGLRCSSSLKTRFTPKSGWSFFTL